MEVRALLMLSILCLFGKTSSQDASDPVTPKALTCSTPATELKASPVTVGCPKRCASASARVWGTGEYTDDSALCKAAVHTGLVDNRVGGVIIVTISDGLESYTGSTQNGVTSLDYGAWIKKVTFSAATNVKPQELTCTTKGTELFGSPVMVICPSGCASVAKTVWGEVEYTDDSVVCKAAAHGGYVDDSVGGPVIVETIPGLQSYIGSTKNGVTTTAYGPWNDAFIMRKPPAASATTTTAAPTTTAATMTKITPAPQVQNVSCSTTGKKIPNDIARIRCPPNCCFRTISLWGTGCYAENSLVCQAAVHAGKIGNNGGVVTVKKTPGHENYYGSKRNGVKSQSCGYALGFIFQ